MDFIELQEQINQISVAMSANFSIAIETSEGRIYINAEQQATAASLIKIPIMIEAYRQAGQGTLQIHERKGIPGAQRVSGTGVIRYMSQEIGLSFEDLIALMIIVSDNTATNVIIDQIGMGSVNVLAGTLNCSKTMLARKMADTKARENGVENYTSAADMVVFLKEIMHGTMLDEAARSAAYNTLAGQQLNGKLPVNIPGGTSANVIIAHKTGELPGIEHDVGIFDINGQRAYVAVLTWGLSENADGRRSIADVGRTVFDYLST
jgi:beta-lactamase class A